MADGPVSLQKGQFCESVSRVTRPGPMVVCEIGRRLRERRNGVTLQHTASWLIGEGILGGNQVQDQPRDRALLWDVHSPGCIRNAFGKVLARHVELAIVGRSGTALQGLVGQ